MLPGVDGRSILRLLKEDARTAHIPVLAISAATRLLTDAERALAAAVIGKPFDIEALLGVVADLVRT